MASARRWPTSTTRRLPLVTSLTPHGHAQAAAVAAGWTRAPSLIVVSPFLRTRQTAAPLIARYPEAPAACWPVQEFTYLSPERCAGTTAAERRPWVEAYWGRLDPAHVDGPGAESFAAMAGRARALLARLVAHPAGRVAVFTHGQLMQCCRLLGLPPEGHAEADDQALMRRFLEAERRAPVGNGAVIAVAG